MAGFDLALTQYAQSIEKKVDKFGGKLSLNNEAGDGIRKQKFENTSTS